MAKTISCFANYVVNSSSWRFRESSGFVESVGNNDVLISRLIFITIHGFGKCAKSFKNECVLFLLTVLVYKYWISGRKIHKISYDFLYGDRYDKVNYNYTIDVYKSQEYYKGYFNYCKYVRFSGFKITP